MQRGFPKSEMTGGSNGLVLQAESGCQGMVTVPRNDASQVANQHYHGLRRGTRTTSK